MGTLGARLSRVFQLSAPASDDQNKEFNEKTYVEYYGRGKAYRKLEH